MVGSFFNFLDLPEYYDDKLLLRVVREPSTPASAGAFASQSSLLTSLQDDGTILKVTPIRVQQTECLSMAVGAAGLTHAEEPSIETVASIAELKTGSLRKVLRQLGDEDGVEVERLPIRYLCATPAAIPPREGPLWNFERIQWEESRNLQNVKQATDITVAVLDTGIEAEHPDLAGRIE